MKNKVKLSLSLSANDPAQMLALASFAKALAESQTAVTQNVNKAVAFGLEGITQAPQSKSSASMVTILTEAIESFEPKSEEEKPKRKRRTAAEIKADSEAAESESAEEETTEPEQENAPEPEPTEQPKISKITLDDIRRVVAEKKEKHLQVMKFKLSQDFGVTKTPDLSPDQYEAFYKFLESLD
jgi:outer membrane biosynthesis protein TonB